MFSKVAQNCIIVICDMWSGRKTIKPTYIPTANLVAREEGSDCEKSSFTHDHIIGPIF